jgi:adenosyl cobinamide kinase/adenosyl cobinamide phosphate guanylyltransferase
MAVESRIRHMSNIRSPSRSNLSSSSSDDAWQNTPKLASCVVLSPLASLLRDSTTTKSHDDPAATRRIRATVEQTAAASELTASSLAMVDTEVTVLLDKGSLALDKRILVGWLQRKIPVISAAAS